MASAEHRHTDDLLHRGMLTYAEHCVACHGAAGQGFVGPPLNREDFRGDPDDKKDVFDLIVTTVRDGRPGTTTPHWEQVVTGEWASYTAMPTFGSANGGPLNELYLRAVATFIMTGDWSTISGQVEAPNVPADDDVLFERLVDAAGLSAAENRAAKEVFVDRGCITCHTIGGVGGNFGPDLSQVGTWTRLMPVDEWEDFLYDWVENPGAIENRAPVYWSNYSGPLPFAGGDADAALALPQAIELPPTQMPPMPMTDEERAILVRWLARLGR